MEQNNELPVIESETVVDERGLPGKNTNSQYSHGIAQNDLELLNLEKEDLSWKITARKRYSEFFCGMLAAQNFIVYGLVYHAYATGELKSLSIILSTLIVGTLVETAYIVKIMIKWIFSNSKYTIRNHKK